MARTESTDSASPSSADGSAGEEHGLVAQEISSEEVKSRAVKGASTMMVRGLAIRALGLVGNIVLARLLTPEDFGVAALGVTIIILSAALSDGGLATVFVRGKKPPTRDELRAAISVQLYITGAIVAACFAAAFILETKSAWVVAAMAAPVSVVAFRVPAFVHFERTLEFGPIVRVEIGETLVSLVVSVGCAVAGFGVWSFVAGQIARVLVGTSMMVRLGPDGLVLPRWDTAIVRRLLKYGLQFQGIAVAGLGLGQGLNVAVAAAGGVAALGVWALISRLLQIPVLVFQGLRRVSYPGVARLLANGDDLAPVLLRVSKLACVLGALMVVPVLGAADPGVVLLFGDQWTDAANVLPWCVAVVFINGPISVAAFSYATVSGKLTTALWSSVTQAVGGPLLVVALYPVVGLSSLIIATGVVACVDAIVLGTVLYRGLRANVLPVILIFGGMAVAAGLAGREIALSIDNDGLATLAGALGAELALFVLIMVLQPSVGRDTIRLASRALNRGGKPAPAPTEPVPDVAMPGPAASTQARIPAPVFQQAPARVAPAFDQPPVPPAPAFDQPSVPPAPAFDQPSVPAFDQPSVPPAPAFDPGVPSPVFSEGQPVESAPWLEPIPEPLPTYEELLPVDGAPVFNEAPPAPAFEQPPAFEQAPAFEPAPAFDQAPAFEPAPASEQAPAFGQPPAFEPAPIAPPVPVAVNPAAPEPVMGQAAAAARVQAKPRPRSKKAAADEAISLLSGRPIADDELPEVRSTPRPTTRGRWTAQRGRWQGNR